MLDIGTFSHDQLEKLNSLTQYPSIPTYHAMGDRGRLTDEVQVDFSNEPVVLVTEKIDGTNARVVFCEEGHRTRILVGSRTEWLTSIGDLIANPAMGIVDATTAFCVDILMRQRAMPHYLTVVYGEAYGGNIGKHAQRYAPRDRLAFCVFDAWAMMLTDVETMLALERAEIAAWRDAGKQPFGRGREHLGAFGVPLTPGLRPEAPPTGLRESLEWLKAVCPDVSYARLADDVTGRPEGVVVRTPDRSKIAKLRFEDYERTLR